MATRYLPAVLMVCVLVLTGCPPAQEPADKGEKPASEEPEPVPLQTSPWGEWNNGLQCRAIVPKSIEQGMPLEAQVEFNCEATDVPEGAKKLNTFLHSAYLKLLMRNMSTEQTFEIRPHDPTQGMPAEDTGKYTAPLDGSEIEPWKTTFPLVRARDGFIPGMYECQVEFTYSWEHKAIGWHGTKAEWEAAGFWTGTITSGPFTLKILKETPKTETFFLPKRLRLEKGLQIKYRKEDAQEVHLPIRNGFFLAAKYYHNDNSNFYMQSGPPVPDDVNYIDYWYGYKGGDVHYTLTIEIFETADPPVHMWSPGPGSGGYKVLWKKSFDVNYTEKEIKALK